MDDDGTNANVFGQADRPEAGGKDAPEGQVLPPGFWSVCETKNIRVSPVIVHLRTSPASADTSSEHSGGRPRVGFWVSIVILFPERCFQRKMLNKFRRHQCDSIDDVHLLPVVHVAGELHRDIDDHDLLPDSHLGSIDIFISMEQRWLAGRRSWSSTSWWSSPATCTTGSRWTSSHDRQCEDDSV